MDASRNFKIDTDLREDVLSKTKADNAAESYSWDVTAWWTADRCVTDWCMIGSRMTDW